MNERCEVNLSPFARGPEDPRYEPCGKPARFKVEDGEDGTWMCADHYDGHARLTGKIYEDASEEL
jgi:hypothetical protein